MMINPRCGEVWETRRVFQGAVGKRKAFSMAPAALRSRWDGA
jgi:hypothetical protein